MIQGALLQLVSHYFAATGVVADCGDGTKNCDTGLPDVTANGSNLQNLLQIVFATIAALAVLMIVIAGVRFVTSQGNAQEVSKARNTIVYALVGLLVALLSEALVTFVLVNL